MTVEIKPRMSQKKCSPPNAPCCCYYHYFMIIFIVNITIMLCPCTVITFSVSKSLSNFSVSSARSNYQKQPHRDVPRKRRSENMQQIHRRTPMPKCNFNKVAKLQSIGVLL